jgi:hypothetical protein
MSKRVLLEGVVPVSIVVDLDTGSIVQCNVHKDLVRWTRPPLHIGSLRAVNAGNHTAAELIATTDTWNLILERDPLQLRHDRRPPKAEEDRP